MVRLRVPFCALRLPHELIVIFLYFIVCWMLTPTQIQSRFYAFLRAERLFADRHPFSLPRTRRKLLRCGLREPDLARNSSSRKRSSRRGRQKRSSPPSPRGRGGWTLRDSSSSRSDWHRGEAIRVRSCETRHIDEKFCAVLTDLHSCMAHCTSPQRHRRPRRRRLVLSHLVSSIFLSVHSPRTALYLSSLSLALPSLSFAFPRAILRSSSFTFDSLSTSGQSCLHGVFRKLNCSLVRRVSPTQYIHTPLVSVAMRHLSTVRRCTFRTSARVREANYDGRFMRRPEWRFRSRVERE